MFNFDAEAESRHRERKHRNANRWSELQILCNALNGTAVHRKALLNAWERYNNMIRRHRMKESQFLQEIQDGGWGTFKDKNLGRIGISKKIGKALRALIEQGSSHIRTCSCGTVFVAKRSTRKHCSERCKQSARLTDEYRKGKAAYMRRLRKIHEEMRSKPIRYTKRPAKLSSLFTR